MSKNIQMNYFNGNDYEELYPQSLLNNITDWANVLYNKTQTDNLISNLDSSLKSWVNSQLSNSSKIETGTYTGISDDMSTTDYTSTIITSFNPKFVMVVALGYQWDMDWAGDNDYYEITGAFCMPGKPAVMTQNILNISGNTFIVHDYWVQNPQTQKFVYHCGLNYSFYEYYYLALG